MSINISRKVLFSNLSYRTTEQSLINYFAQYGSIEEFALYRDDQEQSLREGFLLYHHSNSLDQLMNHRPHIIDDRTVQLRRFIPKESINPRNLSDQLAIHLTVNEIFLNRLYANETREMFIDYFQSFGSIVDCRVYHSTLKNGKSTGYAFVRFSDYDSVDRVILSRPHRINAKIYPLRKCIPREFNYIISSTKALSANKPVWHHYAIGLINTKTDTIIYPTSTDNKLPSKTSVIFNPCPTMSTLSVMVERTPTKSNADYELVTNQSISPSSVSLVHSTDNFTPLASPLYSTAIAYSSPTELLSKSYQSKNSYLLNMVDQQDKQSFEMI